MFPRPGVGNVRRVADAVVVASHRGPLSFRRDAAGELIASRGAGGLVSSLAPLVAGTSTLWVAAAVGEADRDAAAQGLVEATGFRYRCLALDEADHRLAYDVVSNATLWFLTHRLFDLTRTPAIGSAWRAAWAAYRRINRAFAEAIAEEADEGATVLLQDYHLWLVAGWLAEERPDLVPVMFTHTPFCEPSDLRVLPDDVVEELLEGLVANRACGFHTRRWAAAFEACVEERLGLSPPTFVSPLAPDAAGLAEVAGGPACARAGWELEAALAGRRMILRVDRIELSKNLLRGFAAYDELLSGRPDLRGAVVFVAFVYPSREAMGEYAAYRREIEAKVDEVNRRWGTPGWTPIILDPLDDFPRSVAAYQRYDVLLVNPVRDGLNLVAMEGPLVNRRDGVLVLSREAGAWDTLGDAALGINPFDVGATAAALADALDLGPDDRRAHAEGLRRRVSARTATDWLDDQLLAASKPPGPA